MDRPCKQERSGVVWAHECVFLCKSGRESTGASVLWRYFELCEAERSCTGWEFSLQCMDGCAEETGGVTC